jgi:probable F420-dependent oxidoreductase
MELSKPGIWFYPDALSAKDVIAFGQRTEAQGYSALWLPEAGGRDPFVLAALILENTSTLVVATGIANIYARDAMAMKAAQYSLFEQSNGRFLLGIGVSHQFLVEDIRGHTYGPPVATMRAYLEGMEAAAYGGPEPQSTPPTVLGALGPRMLETARDHAAGAHPYMVPPEHTATARALLGPEPLLCVEQKVVFEQDPGKARSIARNAAALGMGLSLPNYRNSLMRLGFGDADFDDGLSDRLVDAVVAWGDANTIRERIRAHYDAGATHVCIHPLHPEGLSVPYAPLIDALAPNA